MGDHLPGEFILVTDTCSILRVSTVKPILSCLTLQSGIVMIQVRQTDG